MPPESEMPGARVAGQSRVGRRLRVTAIILLAAFFLLLISLRGIAGFYTDFLWFDALDLTSVWSRILVAKIVLALIFIGLFFLLCWLNLFIADRLAPGYRPPGPEEDVLARFHEIIGTRTSALRLAVSLLFAISVGAGAAAQWQNWILFTNRVDFEIDDAFFGNDVGFYVFQLPFLGFVVDWLFTALIIVLIITSASHYLNGGIRIQTRGERVTPQVKAHLSLLLAALALVRTVDYWLARFELTTSSAGTVDGATFTDVNARLPVLNLLVLISLFAAGLLIVNIWRRGWVLPALAVGLWTLVSVIMGGIYPFVVQRFQVEPAESTKERIFIERNIEATRQAFGLDDVESVPFPYAEELTGNDLLANADVLRNVPLLDPEVVADTFRFEQAEREFFRFPDEVDVDRYTINGEVVPVVIAARGLNTAGLSSPSWESEHLTFTHGNGLALAPSNTTDGQLPDFLIGDVPPDNEIASDVIIDQPRLYYGEDITSYAIVDSGRQEVDFIDDENNSVLFTYDGEGGVLMGGFFRQASFALRFGSIDPLISDFVASDSRIMYRRNVSERVREVAPFLEFDSDPYPVVVEGRIVYVVDGYTTSSRYPYGQRALLEQVSNVSGLRTNFNYVRNSVKATVDGYDGTVRLFISDTEDPIVAAYRKAFPELFEDIEQMSSELQEHLRYPVDLFTVQTNMWSRYQIDDPVQFYEQAGGWAVSQDPGGVEGPDSNPVGVDGRITGSRDERVDPYYTLLRLPGTTESEFVVMRSFVPVSAEDDRKELTAFMAGVSRATSDGTSYGELVEYTMPGTQVLGPALVASKILSQEDISKEISLLDVEGTSVVLNDLLLVPIEDSILYVRPLYVKQTTGTENPELEWVIVSYADGVVMCPGFAEALQALFGVRIDGVQSGSGREECIGDTRFAVTGGDSGQGTLQTEAAEDVDDAVATALLRLNEANRALERGDLGRYQELVDEARGLLESAELAELEADAAAEDEGEPA